MVIGVVAVTAALIVGLAFLKRDFAKMPEPALALPRASPQTWVNLERVKADKRLAGMALVRTSRLSVPPASDAELAAHLPDGRTRTMESVT